MLRLQHVSAGYGESRVLSDINLTVELGNILAVLGPNGAGKTTLLRAVSGMINIYEGDVDLDGQSTLGRDVDAVARLGVAHVPEGRGLFPSMTVEENLLLGAYPFRTLRDTSERVEHALEVFPALRPRRHSQAASLSGGQQQMLALARALVAEPAVLLLDEPSLGLSPRLVDEVLGAVDRIRHTRAMAVVLAEQAVEVALSVADHSLVLQHGRVVLEGTAEDIRREDAVVGAYFGAMP